MIEDVELSIIVPCLNEEDNITEALDLLKKKHGLEGFN